MKRLVTFLLMMLILIALLLSGCGYSEEQLAEAYSEGYDAGHNEGYNTGYDTGYEEGKFYFYYVKPQQRYGVDDLQEYLTRWEWQKGTYVRNKFDCSEMSVYMERILENEGYHTLIVVGPTPFPSSDPKHAWLLVEASSGGFMPVEAAREGAPWQVVDWSDLYFANYFKYDYTFETIENALRYNYEEFSWWEE